MPWSLPHPFWPFAEPGPDETPPIITLNGPSNLLWSRWVAWTDPGYTAFDNVDGDITANVVVGGDTVDVDTPGVYVITYDVTDAADNHAVQRIRTVTIAAPTPIDAWNQPIYDLSIVARTPAESGPPNLVELGRIPAASQLTWTEQLNRDGEASVRCDPGLLNAEMRHRLRNLRAAPCELWVFRNGVARFCGPILGYSSDQTGLVTLKARGLFYYTAYMEVHSDLEFAQVDQYEIAATLIDQWQTMDWGDFGIDTAHVGVSGTLRDRTYLAAEQHLVFDRIPQLAAVIGGFDFAVHPASRRLTLEPMIGADLSATVVLDRRGIEDPSATVSVAAGDVASEAVARGSGEPPIIATANNATVRQSFGRSAVSAMFDGVTEQTTLDAYAEALLVPRGEPLLVPTPRLIPVVGAGVDDFGVGDIVEYTYDHGFGLVSEHRRVTSRKVTLGDDGQDTIEVAFA